MDNSGTSKIGELVGNGGSFLYRDEEIQGVAASQQTASVERVQTSGIFYA